MLRSPVCQAQETGGVARPPCPSGQHRWQPTCSAGEFVCLLCGRRALCPACVYVLPRLPFVALHSCDRHQSVQREAPTGGQGGHS
jgi:hypothetical protein